jgi:iron complex outermembrane receptor protein
LSATYGRNESVGRVQNSIHAGNMEDSIYANQDMWFGGTPMDRSFLEQEGMLYTENNKGGNEQFTLAAGYSGVTENDIGYAFGA